ncbi:MAG: DUF3828 domain-containing protein [Pyrinomonadaceae bacterium]
MYFCRQLIFIFLLFTGFVLFGCSQPVLESGECIEARVPVRRFYSFHLGNEMKPTKANLEKRIEFLSGRLKDELSVQPETTRDYFTQTDDFPTAFRAGKCSTKKKDRVEVEILLFWRKDETNIQRMIRVEAVRENSKWLIDKVTSQN